MNEDSTKWNIEIPKKPLLYKEVDLATWKELHGINNGLSELMNSLMLGMHLHNYDKARGEESTTSPTDFLSVQDPRIANNLSIGEIISLPKGWDFIPWGQTTPIGTSNPTGKYAIAYYKVTSLDANDYFVTPVNWRNSSSSIQPSRIPRHLVDAENPKKPINWRALVSPGGEVEPGEKLPKQVEFK